MSKGTSPMCLLGAPLCSLSVLHLCWLLFPRATQKVTPWYLPLAFREKTPFLALHTTPKIWQPVWGSAGPDPPRASNVHWRQKVPAPAKGLCRAPQKPHQLQRRGKARRWPLLNHRCTEWEWECLLICFVCLFIFRKHHFTNRQQKITKGIGKIVPYHDILLSITAPSEVLREVFRLPDIICSFSLSPGMLECLHGSVHSVAVIQGY